MAMELRHDSRKADSLTMGQWCQVSLIDRRSGQPMRQNGAVVTKVTRQPHQAAAELLDGRDARCWQPRVSPLQTKSRD